MERQLTSIAGRIQAAGSSLKADVPGIILIKNQIALSSQSAELLSGRVGLMGSTLGSISSVYEKTETALTSMKSATGAEAINGGGATKTESEGNGLLHWDKVKWFSWSDLWKAVGSAGIVGSIVSGIGGIFTADGLAKKVLGAAKGAAKVTGTIAGAISKNSFDWFGLASKASKDVPKTIWESLGKEADKYKLGKATNVSGKVAVAAKWAGGAVTVASTAYDNLVVNKEGNSTGRAIAETIGESAVKIVGGALITSAAAMLGGPAIVTAGVAVGATWLINRAFEAATGKDAAEAISDFVLDTGKALYDGAKTVAQNVGNAISSAGKKIGGWWQRAWGRPAYA